MPRYDQTPAGRAFIDSGASLETSPELMAAIARLARATPEARRIWASPTESEMLAIWETATNNGLTLASDYCWGAAGSRWWPA